MALAVNPNLDRARPNDEEQVFPYLFKRMVVHYLWDEGVMAAPLAVKSGYAHQTARNARPACRAIRKHAPFGRKVVIWEANRQGAKPDFPDPDQSDKQLLLEKAEIVLGNPQEDGRGRGYIFPGNAYYTYILLVPLTQLDELACPMPLGVKGSWKTNRAQFRPIRKG